MGIQLFNSHTCDWLTGHHAMPEVTHTHMWLKGHHATPEFTLHIPREAVDFPWGGNQSKHMPLPTYLDWL